MSARTQHTATYSYPGMLFAEETSREISEPTLAAALANAPSETEGYFREDGWYAVAVSSTTQKLFTAEDGEQTWVNQGTQRVLWAVVGERIHVDDIDDGERHDILRANIRGNSKDGYAVLTRCGNWQIASDYDVVLTPAEATS